MDGSPVKNGHRRVEAMLDLQNHRGPDDKGVVLSDDGRLALGNVRVPIVVNFGMHIVSLWRSRNCQKAWASTSKLGVWIKQPVGP